MYVCLTHLWFCFALVLNGDWGGGGGGQNSLEPFIEFGIRTAVDIVYTCSRVSVNVGPSVNKFRKLSPEDNQSILTDMKRFVVTPCNDYL